MLHFRNPSLRALAEIAAKLKAEMTLVVPDGGEVVALNLLFNKVAAQNQVIDLYQNNWTPAETDTDASYTVANFPGYAAKNLTGADWTVTSGAPTQAVAPAQLWTCSGSTNQNIYGYKVKQVTSGILLFAERLSGVPFNIANNGDNVSVTPTFTAD
jgi:hypothetical protein